MIRPLKLFVHRTCAYNFEHPAVGNYLFELAIQLQRDPRFQKGRMLCGYDTIHRIHLSRNNAAKSALEMGSDFLLFVDSDMVVDPWLDRSYLDEETRKAIGVKPWAKPFFWSSLDYMLSNRCGVIGAPAVSAPPENNLNVFLVRGPGQASRMTHEEYANHDPCFLECLAVGTGVMLIDCQVFKEIPHPWFEDAYDPDGQQYDVMQSQDARFCIKCTEAGFPVFANLYAPAGHAKNEVQYVPELRG